MRGQGSPLTDAASGPTAAEWAAAILATLPRLTDEQWTRANATLGVALSPHAEDPAHASKPHVIAGPQAAA